MNASPPIQSAPLRISGHAEGEMTPSVADTVSRILKERRPTAHAPPCQKYVNIGLFFDGTNNNMVRDEPSQCHTNIVKLYKAHRDVDGVGTLQASGHYRIYVPGLGTRFPENREWRESADGKAFGKGGQARILFGLFEVYNAVHKAFSNDDDMFDKDAVAAKIQQYAKDVETNDPLRDAREPRPDRRSWFDGLTKDLDTQLRKARKHRPLPNIPKITLNVFGFSRGAVEARAFCYWFDDLLAKDGTFADMPAEITFLGLFDSVASIGLANSASETTPLFFANGHLSWASETRKPLPPCVKRTVHFIGAHEQRRNFPLTRVTGNNVTECLYPGVHSDVGGGYSPGDHGRGTTMDKMLSQIPLLHMHREACRAGVPLLSYCDMASDLKEDYDIDSDLTAAWNAYMAALEFKPDTNDIVIGNYKEMIQKHMQLYYGFRRRWLNEFRDLPSYDRANAQDQEDLNSYNNLLKGDLAILRKRRDFATRNVGGINGHRVTLEFEEEQSANRWQVILANSGVPPNKEELWVLEQFNKTPPSSDPPYLWLLQNQIHDSLATFYLAGYVTAEEKSEAVLMMAREYDATGKTPTTAYKKQVWDNYQNMIKADPGLADAVQNRVDAYKQSGAKANNRLDQIKAKEMTDQQTPFGEVDQAKLADCFPPQTDTHAQELRLAAIRTQTETRREGSGYLHQRAVFD
ncbi:T6SS phospholipase effector Tle1-like catalytic domain-containing protein [Collimonas antrihumi]|uniref:T6SS phospholipase effector Tle1-like catalytic domain-containing protein n=1 Tax=Collimonas antrihumi TaxID=1940615 RepID=UPI001B8A90AC|nr:DUF2235 domain-containing protein [Collimonas antrihumi]